MKLVRARRAEPAKAVRFERRLAGSPPDFSGGVRFLEVDRMRNHVRTHPYSHYLEKALGELK